MEVDLGGGVVIVTGAAQGIGAEIATLAAASGAGGLLLTDRNGALGREVAARLGAACPVAFVEADLAEVDGARAVIAGALERFGRVDMLVNAAGITDRASFLDGTEALWDRLFAVNARAPYFLMQGAIADMAGAKAPGAIVNIAVDQRALRDAGAGDLFGDEGGAGDAHAERGQRASGGPHPGERRSTWAGR